MACLLWKWNWWLQAISWMLLSFLLICSCSCTKSGTQLAFTLSGFFSQCDSETLCFGQQIQKERNPSEWKQAGLAKFWDRFWSKVPTCLFWSKVPEPVNLWWKCPSIPGFTSVFGHADFTHCFNSIYSEDNGIFLFSSSPTPLLSFLIGSTNNNELTFLILNRK